DRCVFIDGLGALVSGNDVQMTGGALAPEYQRVTLLEATSDANGYFRFPSIHRIAALHFVATATGHAPLDIDFQPDYTARENGLLVVFA
ncbi:MAG TPA: hypothetical protein VKJ01_10275, partial [Candidatus Solibacter sp.]|nr:hypothetical protein [Candidatus Solibacter sp.]